MGIFSFAKELGKAMSYKCPICGKKLGMTGSSHKLADQTAICTDCWQKPRIMYPVTYSENQDYIDYSQKSSQERQRAPSDVRYTNWHDDVPDQFIRHDPIYQLTLEQFRAALSNLEAYTAGIRQQFGGHANVFVVDRVVELDPNKDKVRITNLAHSSEWILDPQGKIMVEGRIVLGRFFDGYFEGKIFRSGTTLPLGIHQCSYLYNGDSRYAKEGYPAGEEARMIVDKGSVMQGDAIVSD
ncbi:MAG: DUF4428 domain-containing protein [Clostridiales bacterium]|nr:DUF4428 domain-containing protein [Clostridiales bacterium]